MKKLYEVLGVKLLTADVGIEIECEGHGLTPVNSAYWRTEQDGSLRGEYPHECAEFVLKKPIHEKSVKPAIDQLIEAQKDAVLNFSYRTSVHIHVNCLDMNATQLLTFAYAYLLFEIPLLNYCGDERKGNRFCLRLRDAEKQLRPLSWMITEGFRSIGLIDPNEYRYAAMNLAALPKYGSVEFRSMRGNLEKEVLTTWVTALLELRAFSLKYNSPKELYEDLAKLGTNELFKKCFTTTYDSLFYPGMDRDVLESVSLSIEIPFEWERQQDMEKERKEMDKLAGKVIYEVIGDEIPPALNLGDLMQRARLRNVPIEAVPDPLF